MWVGRWIGGMFCVVVDRVWGLWVLWLCMGAVWCGGGVGGGGGWVVRVRSC